MSEFKPNEGTSVDLERAILELKNKKTKLITEKTNNELTLGELRSEREKINPKSERGIEITNERAKLKHKAAKIEIQIKEINQEVKNKRMLLLEVNNFLKANKQTDKSLDKLTRLKDKYREFSADNTRVASMRIMASKFADELESIINN